MDKFLQETEQYLAEQGLSIPTSEENTRLMKKPSQSPKGTNRGRRKPQKLILPKSFAEKEESSVNYTAVTSQKCSSSQTIFAKERSADSKQEVSYKSNWFDKIKNKFENTDVDMTTKTHTRNKSDDITYDEIDEDSEGPYMPTSEVVERKEIKEEQEAFYKHPPPPRPLSQPPSKRETQRTVPEHIYEEIAPSLTTPVRYRRKKKQKTVDSVDDKRETGRDVALKPAAKTTTSCMTSLASCMPWWMAKR